MFKKDEMCAAFDKLFNLLDEDGQSMCDEDGMPYYKRICLSDVCMMLRNRVTVPYEYTVDTTMERGFKYCGTPLFNQQACKVYSDMEVQVSDMVDSIYGTELWLLEDMTFVITHCVTLFVEGDTGEFYETEYRTVVKEVKERDDLFFTPEELEDEFEELCEDIWESEATIYEM